MFTSITIVFEEVSINVASYVSHTDVSWLTFLVLWLQYEHGGTWYFLGWELALVRILRSGQPLLRWAASH